MEKKTKAKGSFEPLYGGVVGGTGKVSREAAKTIGSGWQHILANTAAKQTGGHKQQVGTIR